MPFQMVHRVFCIWLSTVIGILCYSQKFQSNDFKHYTSKDGLTDNNIVGIQQDSAGYVWIATLHGLNRFDGNIFKTFLKTSRYNRIPDDAIFSMKLLGRELAIATDDGAQIISTNTLTQKDLFIPSSDALHYWSNSCRYVNVDKQGNYGVSTKTGFYIFSPQGQLKKRFDYFTEKDIGHSWMMFGNHVFKLADGDLMQQNSSGLLIYDPIKNVLAEASSYYPKIREIDPSLNNQQLFLFVSSYQLLLLNVNNNSFDLIDIRNGNSKSFPACIKLQEEIGWQTNPVFLDNSTLAINSRNKGFFLVHIDTLAKTISCLPERYFNGHFCNTIFLDNQKRIWIGTNKGLYVQNIRPSIINSFKIDDGFSKDNFAITSLFITHDKIFAGTSKKNILVINKANKKIIKRLQLVTHPFLSNQVTNFQHLSPDTLLVSTTSGINWLNVKNLSTGQPDFETFRDSSFTVNFLFADKSANIWLPNNKINTIYSYNVGTRKMQLINDESQKLFKINQSNSIAEDKEGNIWFGGDAIARWNSRLRKMDTLIERLPTQKNWKKGFFVMSDSKGEIWIMLNGDGFARITNNLMHLRPENILPDNKGIYPTMLRDKIFVPTTTGLGFLDLKTGKGVIFHNQDGLPDKPITTIQFAIDSTDGSTWFACEDILCNIPSSASNYYRQPPVLAVSDVAVINDTVINYPNNIIQLKYNQNDINVSFSAINFIDPENMRFAYRINNREDSSWIEAGNQPNILLTNISPGNYKLEMKLYAYDNKWPEQIKEIQFSIQPPFWKTWWFFSMIALVIIAGIYFVYTNRISEVRKRARIDKQMAEYEIKALHAQMNPHFIFNCLNSIREMILNNENQQASHYLSKFAHLIRVTLNNSSRPFISLQNTVDYLKRYLEMEQIRKTNFSYLINVDESLEPEEVFLPPMLIQPFIENAIWHGASTANGMVQINIRFLTQNNHLVCIVEDNGMGIQASLKKKYERPEIQADHLSLGISNVKQRIHVLNEKYNLHSRVTIEDKSNLTAYDETGTIVTLYLYLKNTEL
jgi:ligand-binding sensor domain-containing protein